MVAITTSSDIAGALAPKSSVAPSITLSCDFIFMSASFAEFPCFPSGFLDPRRALVGHALEQAGADEHGDGQKCQKDRDRRDHRREVLLDVVEHHARQGLVADAREEERDHRLVEGDDEREKAAGDDVRHDHGKGDERRKAVKREAPQLMAASSSAGSTLDNARGRATVKTVKGMAMSEWPQHYSPAWCPRAPVVWKNR